MSADLRLEEQIKQLQFPEVSVSDQVMEKITAKKLRRPIWHQNRIVFTCAIFIVLLGAGFSTAKWIQLYHKNGDLLLSVKNFDANNPKPNSVYSEDMINKFLNEIQVGEAIAIYDPSQNANGIVLAREKTKTLFSWEEVKNVVKGEFPIPAELPAGLMFQEGYVYHELGLPDMTMLRNQSEAKKGQVVFEKVVVKDKITSAVMKVSISGVEYTISLNEGSRWDTVYTDLTNMKQLKKIPIGRSEALLSLDEEATVLRFRSEASQGDVYYTITASDTSPHTEKQLLYLLELLLPRH